MISLGSRLIACCKLAPTLARQMWRHNYVIDRNEKLIFTFSESINPWVYSVQFYFCSNPQIIHGDMKENVSVYDLGWLWMAWMFIIRYGIAICFRVIFFLLIHCRVCLRRGTARDPHKSARSGVYDRNPPTIWNRRNALQHFHWLQTRLIAILR